MALVNNQEFILETMRVAHHQWKSSLNNFLHTHLSFKIVKIAEKFINFCTEVIIPGKEYLLPKILYIFHEYRDEFFKFAVNNTEHYIFIKTMLNEAAAEFSPDATLLSRIAELETAVAQMQEQLYYLPGNSPGHTQGKTHWDEVWKQ
jgi:hypothetical protein